MLKRKMKPAHTPVKQEKQNIAMFKVWSTAFKCNKMVALTQKLKQLAPINLFVLKTQNWTMFWPKIIDPNLC